MSEIKNNHKLYAIQLAKICNIKLSREILNCINEYNTSSQSDDDYSKLNQQVFRIIKPTLDKIKKYNAYAWIFFLLSLSIDNISKLKNKEPLDWIFLLLFRFIIKHAELTPLTNNYRMPLDIPDDVYKVLYDCYFVTQNYGNITYASMLRRWHHTQYMFQGDTRYAILSIMRQLIMFVDLDQNNKMQDIFKKKFGLEIIEYLECLFCIAAVVLIAQKPIEKLEHQVAKNITNILSKDCAGLKVFLEEYEKSNCIEKDIISQLQEFSPFIRYPLVLNDSKLYPINAGLLCNSIKYNLYSMFKNELSKEFNNNFGQFFGNSFENYIKLSMENNKITYTTITYKKGKKADFIIKENDINIIIECKATGFLNTRPVKNEFNFQETIIGAVLQILTTYDREKNSNNGTLNIKSTYGLIVTYKEYGIGNIKEFVTEESNKDDSINNRNQIKKYLETIYSLLQKNNEFTLDNIIMMDIEAWDLLLSITRNNHSIFDTLENISQDRKNPNTFLKLEALLEKYGISDSGYKIHDLLNDSSKKLVKVLKDKYFINGKCILMK